MVPTWAEMITEGSFTVILYEHLIVWNAISRFEKMTTSQEPGLKISFKGRHYKDTAKENAEYVELEYHDKGQLKWRSIALAQRWDLGIDYDHGSLDCIMVECQTEGCPWKDHQASIHVYLDRNHGTILLEPHREPMCKSHLGKILL